MSILICISRMLSSPHFFIYFLLAYRHYIVDVGLHLVAGLGKRNSLNRKEERLSSCHNNNNNNGVMFPPFDNQCINEKRLKMICLWRQYPLWDSNLVFALPHFHFATLNSRKCWYAVAVANNGRVFEWILAGLESLIQGHESHPILPVTSRLSAAFLKRFTLFYRVTYINFTLSLLHFSHFTSYRSTLRRNI